MTGFAALVVPALVYVGVLLLKALLRRDKDGGWDPDWWTALWIVGAWVVGFLGLLLASASDWGDQIRLGDTALDQLSVASLVIAALFSGSLAAVGYDVINKAIPSIGQNRLTQAQSDALDVSATVSAERLLRAAGPDGGGSHPHDQYPPDAR